MGLIVALAYADGASSTSSSPSPRWAARRWTSSRTTSASGCWREPDVDEVGIEIVWDPVWTRNAHPRGGARDDARAGDRRVSVTHRLGSLRPQGLRGPAAPRRDRHRGRRGPRARRGPLDLRRAAVDPHDHRAALVDPGGDQAVKTRWPSLSLAGRQQGRARPPLRRVGASAPRRSSRRSPPPRWPRTSSATPARPIPVLKPLGVDADDDGFGGDKRLALLDDELPDWTAFIAANLLVDGVLTTFVASCVDSTIAPIAQRARKILQEEGSHRVHGEAWARRLCRARASATRSSRGCTRRGSTPAAGWARRRSGLRARRSRRGWSRRPGRTSASRCAPGSSRCSRRGRRDLARRAGRLVGLGRRAAPVDAMQPARSATPPTSSASASGAARSSPPVALPRLRLLLRGAARGLRRSRGRRARSLAERLE